MTIIVTVIGIIAFAIAGPIIGCLLAGLDRIISARMQGRVGPPLLQPYYDVRKLFSKENASVNTSEHAYILFAFIFTLVAGGVFFSGGNLLLSVFLVTLSSLLFIVGRLFLALALLEAAPRERRCRRWRTSRCSTSCVAFFMASGWFDVAGVFFLDAPAITTAWLAFLAFCSCSRSLRKSPFDISMSHHHAHQKSFLRRHHRKRPHARFGGSDALVRERAVHGMGCHVLHLVEPLSRSYFLLLSSFSRCTSSRSGSTTTLPARVAAYAEVRMGCRARRRRLERGRSGLPVRRLTYGI